MIPPSACPHGVVSGQCTECLAAALDAEAAILQDLAALRTAPTTSSPDLDAVRAVLTQRGFRMTRGPWAVWEHPTLPWRAQIHYTPAPVAYTISYHVLREIP